MRTSSPPPGWTALWVITAAAALVIGGGALVFLSGLAGLLDGLGQGQRSASLPASVPAAATPALLVVVPRPAPATPPAMPAPERLVALAAEPLPGPRGASLGEPDDAESRPGSKDRQAGEAPQPARASEPGSLTYRELFGQAAAESGFDWRLLAALAYRESLLDPLAVGQDAEMGLMQILPSTWDAFAPPQAVLDPYDPRDNVLVAVRYLQYLQEYLAQRGVQELRWVLVAYNWGPDNVLRVQGQGGWQAVPALQRSYVADILGAAFGRPEDE